MSVNRQPVINRNHPAASLPERPADKPEFVAPATTTAPPSQAGEKLTEVHNARIAPSTKERLLRGVDKLRYETGDRSISLASITNDALVEYLDRRGC